MKYRVLVVEDELSQRILAETILRKHGCSVVGVATAEDAKKKLDGQPFDCLLVDYCLPGMTGVDLVAQVREKDAKVGIVLMTGMDKAEVEEKSEGLFVWCVLEKPVDHKRLVQAIEDASGLANMTPETETRLLREFSVENAHMRRVSTDLMNETGQYPVPG